MIALAALGLALSSAPFVGPPAPLNLQRGSVMIVPGIGGPCDLYRPPEMAEAAEELRQIVTLLDGAQFEVAELILDVAAKLEPCP